jgi:stage III sporulation protein AG
VTSDNELAQVLSGIEGVGRVRVEISFKSDGFRAYASNDRVETRKTEERAKDGTIRNITEENTNRELVMANSSPVLEEVKTPEVVGVLIIAEGADDPAIQEQVVNAVTGLMGISASRVTVLPMNKGGSQ